MTERERNDRFRRGMKVRYVGTQLAPHTGLVSTAHHDDHVPRGELLASGRDAAGVGGE